MANRKILINIDWDIDETTVEETELPCEGEIPYDPAVETNPSEYFDSLIEGLSNEYGYCINSISYWILA